MPPRAHLVLATAALASLPSLARAQAVLFDATKAEMAGSADWVIDADTRNLRVSSASDGPGTPGAGTESNPQRLPNPSSTTVTSVTAETYWAGALSSWGIESVKQGYWPESLPYNASITYGSASNPQDLSRYSTFVVCEPNISFSASEKTAIVNFVKNGGGLVIIADHASSDRNNDGVDAPQIWNDLFSTNSVAANPFGITFNSSSNVSPNSTAVDTTSTDPITHSPFATVSHLAYHNGSAMTISTAANPTVRAAVWTDSSHSNSAVLAAYASYGLGRVVAVGDSSPADDGSGDPNDSLFTGWTSDGGRELFTNATLWTSHSVTYSAPASSNWSSSANWFHSTPPDAGAHVYLAHNDATSRTITYDYTGPAITLASLTLAAPNGSSMTLLQPQGSLTTQSESIGDTVNGFTGSASLSQSAGTHTVAGNLTLGTTSGSTGTYTLSNSAHLTASSLTLGGTPTAAGGNGTLSLTNSSTATLGALKIYPTSSLSLTTSATLLLDYSPSSSSSILQPSSLTSSLDTLRQSLASSLITSPNSDSTHRLAYIDASLLPATSPLRTTALTYADTTTIVLTVTLTGDTNLDGALTPDDYTLLDRSHARPTPNPHWSDGDFNYDGQITSADYLLIDTAYAKTHGLSPELLSQRESQFGATYVSQLLTSIPEPSTPLACLFAKLLFPRRRRTQFLNNKPPRVR